MNNLLKFKNWLIVNGCSSPIYANTIKNILEQIPELNEDNIIEFLVKKKQEGLAEDTLNTYLKSIKAYSRFLHKEINIPPYFKTIEKLPEFITLETLETEIIPYVNDLFPRKKLKIKLLLYFMLYSGLRRGEIIQLRRENFNFSETELKVYMPKVKKERLIPLHKKTINLLQEYFNSEPEKANAFNIKLGGINYIFSKIQTMLNLKTTPHTLRHSFAMYAQRNGCTTREIQSLLGHSNIGSTAKYERADIKLLKEKFKKLK